MKGRDDKMSLCHYRSDCHAHLLNTACSSNLSVSNKTKEGVEKNSFTINDNQICGVVSVHWMTKDKDCLVWKKRQCEWNIRSLKSKALSGMEEMIQQTNWNKQLPDPSVQKLERSSRHWQLTGYTKPQEVLPLATGEAIGKNSDWNVSIASGTPLLKYCLPAGIQ